MKKLVDIASPGAEALNLIGEMEEFWGQHSHWLRERPV